MLLGQLALLGACSVHCCAVQYRLHAVAMILAGCEFTVITYAVREKDLVMAYMTVF